MHIFPLDAPLGARIDDFSVSEIPQQPVVDKIEAALEQYGVLVIPNQILTIQQQIDFSRAFGVVHQGSSVSKTMEGFPEIFEVGNVGSNPISFAPRTSNRDLEWHTDHIQFDVPSKSTFLYAKEIPEIGGDTLFACMYSAFDALDKKLKSICESTIAIHSISGLREYLIEQGQGDSVTQPINSDTQTFWPLVRTHPLSGRPALYFGTQITVGLKGWDEEEAKRFIKNLSSHATQEQFIYRHRWQVGEVVMWDNRRVLHAATPFNENQYRRYLLRTLIKEDCPVTGVH